ncbi:MAG: DUF763 domain-containing protein [Planctomycetota bacterium]|jgi:hypothetical protein
MRTGRADLPLHTGRAPRWLFQRMRRLAGGIVSVMVEEFGPGEVLRRLSDPYWFQAFGCVLGFDWHSSGVTTTACGAIKEGIRGRGADLGLWAAGGKGRTSRKTPEQIARACESCGADADRLVYASRTSAKVDSAALQDGYQIYAHSFFFTSDGSWAVVQQGMNEENRLARRYHWLSNDLASFVEEPHSAICSQRREGTLLLNMTAEESAGAREASAAAARRDPGKLFGDLEEYLFMPRRHDVRVERDVNPRQLGKVLVSTYERQPENFEQLLGIKGVGPKTVRALALIGELIYGEPASSRDPARFSFAHGGKDGTPFPVDRETYDRSIEVLAGCLRRARVEGSDRRGAFARLDALRRSVEAG